MKHLFFVRQYTKIWIYFMSYLGNSRICSTIVVLPPIVKIRNNINLHLTSEYRENAMFTVVLNSFHMLEDFHVLI